MNSINLVVEGKTDDLVMRSLLKYMGIPLERETLILGGKQTILKKLTNYNQAARFTNWLIILDMDSDADCPVTYKNEVLENPEKFMYLRIIVREIEAWLLADAENIANFIGIQQKLIPTDPENLPNPKRKLFELVEKSRNKSLKKDMLPDAKSGRKIGIAYVSRIQEFLTHPTHPWRPEVAQQSADSLMRCIRALSTIPKS